MFLRCTEELIFLMQSRLELWSVFGCHADATDVSKLGLLYMKRYFHPVQSDSEHLVVSLAGGYHLEVVEVDQNNQQSSSPVINLSRTL